MFLSFKAYVKIFTMYYRAIFCLDDVCIFNRKYCLTYSTFQNIYQINLPIPCENSIFLHPVGFRFGHMTYFPTKIWAKGTVHHFCVWLSISYSCSCHERVAYAEGGCSFCLEPRWRKKEKNEQIHGSKPENVSLTQLK